jgi:hypothetical protein
MHCLLPGCAWLCLLSLCAYLVFYPISQGAGPQKQNPLTSAYIWSTPEKKPTAHHFFAHFVLAFLSVSRRGEFKNIQQIFYKTTTVKTFSKTNDKISHVTFSSVFFLFCRVFYWFSVRLVQKHTTKSFSTKK